MQTQSVTETEDYLDSPANGSSETDEARDKHMSTNARALLAAADNVSSYGTSESIAFPSGPLNISLQPQAQGLSTIGYRRALQNRIQWSQIAEGGSYDMTAYRSAFVHDILMLPGSLANLLGKDSSEDILRRMTPAQLRGYKSHVDRSTLLPQLVETSDRDSLVHGMIIFGLGRENRDFIHKHYRRSGAKRRKAQVEVEVSTADPGLGECNGPANCNLSRRTIRTYAWTNASDSYVLPHLPDVAWTLEDYLAGNFESEGTTTLRIEPSAKGDEDPDGYVGRDAKEYELKPERREVVYGGAGSLDYERADHFTGW